jgi:hypothetical protein
MRFAADEFPEEAVALSGVMMHEYFSAIETGFDRDGTDAEAGEALDAAILDDAGDDIEGAVDVGDVLGFHVGLGERDFAPGFDPGGKMFEPLGGAKIQVKVAARVELAGNLGKTGFGKGVVGGRRLGGGDVGLGDESSQGEDEEQVIFHWIQFSRGTTEWNKRSSLWGKGKALNRSKS